MSEQTLERYEDAGWFRDVVSDVLVAVRLYLIRHDIMEHTQPCCGDPGDCDGCNQ